VAGDDAARRTEALSVGGGTAGVAKEALTYVSDEVLPRVTVNVGLIEGGRKINLVADACRAEVDIRLPPGLTLKQVTDFLDEVFARRAQAARAFAGHKWDQRVAISGTEEVADVARAFNDMANSLQRAEALRRNLMADIAHELRTPLAVLQGNLRALLDGVYPLELGEVATLYDETRLLNRLVGDLRELSLAEAGQLRLNLQATDVRALLQAATASFAPVVEAQGMLLAVKVNDGLPFVKADPDRLTQVVRNLLANALRHTPGGGKVTVSASVEKKMIRVVVADIGDGIPAEELPRVFDRFYRGDKSRARTSGGSGLGLAIAKTWMAAMGGEIGVESGPGRGSRFWFTVPMAT
jgi:two-component system OmpR family sensor kinase/two-component system sensor histidine kinase BaeS